MAWQHTSVVGSYRLQIFWFSLDGLVVYVVEVLVVIQYNVLVSEVGTQEM